ncbi:hypothetical protein [Nocardioides sp. SYSU D00038]|uniref:hypothetical protein n=1 Tax=Nocardioides sp. SYSU D00038 TaxID=2812554 RepID=UPI001967D665|nr:hypothetical protein [Nocardioides sp. SYSU D00038]
MAGWSALQEEPAALSSRSRHVTIEEADHVGLLFGEHIARRTTQLVAETVAVAAS